jgi:hypothetical protein
LAAIFAGPEPAGLFYLKCFAGEDPGEASDSSLAASHWSVTKEWNCLLLAYICRNCHYFRSCLEVGMAKKGAYIE